MTTNTIADLRPSTQDPEAEARKTAERVLLRPTGDRDTDVLTIDNPGAASVLAILCTALGAVTPSELAVESLMQLSADVAVLEQMFDTDDAVELNPRLIQQFLSGVSNRARASAATLMRLNAAHRPCPITEVKP